MRGEKRAVEEKKANAAAAAAPGAATNIDQKNKNGFEDLDDIAFDI